MTSFLSGSVGMQQPGTVAFGSADGSALLVTPSGEETLRTNHSGGVAALALGGRERLVTLGSDGNLAVQGLTDGVVFGSHPFVPPDTESQRGWASMAVFDPFSRLTMSADGRRAFASGWDGRVVNVATGELICRFFVTRIAGISPNGTLVAEATGIWDRKIGLYDAQSGSSHGYFGKEYTRGNYALAWAPDGRSIALAGWDKYVGDLETREKIWIGALGDDDLWTVASGPEEFHNLCFSPDGAALAWATSSNVIGITILDSHVDFLLCQLDAPFLAFGFWSSRLVVLTSSGEVSSWNLAVTGRQGRPEHLALRHATK